MDQIETVEFSIYFRHASETDIIESILHPNKQGFIIDVSRKILVICKNYVFYHLKELISFCILSSIYPNVFEFAQITPLHKKGSFHNISNYRPVSALSNISKVCENLIYNRLKFFCQTSKFFAKNHFDYRKNQNTEVATFILIDNFLSSLGEKIVGICVFHDYSAYFVTLSPSILRNKLETYAVHGVNLDFIKAHFASKSHFLCAITQLNHPSDAKT